MTHQAGLQAAAADGELWDLHITWVPALDETEAYIQKALDMQAQGTRCPFVVLDAESGKVLAPAVFTTSFRARSA